MPDSIEVRERRHESESAILDEDTLDKGMHYRFIQTRPAAVARAKLKGYRVVKPSEDGVKTLYDQEDADAEDVIKHGDRILMAVPKARHQKHRKDVRDLATSRIKSVEAKTRQLAREAKIKIHDKEEDD